MLQEDTVVHCGEPSMQQMLVISVSEAFILVIFEAIWTGSEQIMHVYFSLYDGL